MSNQTLDMDVVNKHFEEAPNLSIQPTKLPPAEQVSKNTIKDMTKAYWESKGSSLSDAYEMGRMLANAKVPKTNTDILASLGDTVIQGIKKSNIKSDVSNETLTDHFNILVTILKVVGSDLNEIYEPGNRTKTSTYQPESSVAHKTFDVDEFLATLNGFVTAKIYG